MNARGPSSEPHETMKDGRAKPVRREKWLPVHAVACLPDYFVAADCLCPCMWSLDLHTRCAGAVPEHFPFKTSCTSLAPCHVHERHSQIQSTVQSQSAVNHPNHLIFQYELHITGCKWSATLEPRILTSLKAHPQRMQCPLLHRPCCNLCGQRTGRSGRRLPTAR